MWRTIVPGIENGSELIYETTPEMLHRLGLYRVDEIWLQFLFRTSVLEWFNRNVGAFRRADDKKLSGQFCFPAVTAADVWTVAKPVIGGSVDGSIWARPALPSVIILRNTPPYEIRYFDFEFCDVRAPILVRSVL